MDVFQNELSGKSCYYIEFDSFLEAGVFVIGNPKTLVLAIEPQKSEKNNNITISVALVLVMVFGLAKRRVAF